MTAVRRLWGFGGATALIALSGCEASQSVLHPASDQARQVAWLFWGMTLGGAVLWLLVFGLAVYAVLGKRRPRSPAFADRFVLICGVVLPTLLLFGLMAWSLRLLPDWRSSDPPALRVEVTGEQFWWRVTYITPEGQRVETANVVHLPLGQETELTLLADDVIHSFWIPPLGGKLDMIPGRRNVMRITPDRQGRYRGVCAEFCGLSHTLMAFEAEVMPPEDFAAWLAAEAAPANPGADLRSFEAAGCGACHRIRGRLEQGSTGPDLTHVSSRRMLGADSFPNTRDTLRQWLLDPQSLKPGARMPGYADLPEAELTALIDLLEALP